MEIKLSAVNVSKKIKGRILIDNMSFNIYKGDICGFLGPNGAGKSMLTMWIMLITFIHIMLFGGLSYSIFTKKDKFE